MRQPTIGTLAVASLSLSACHGGSILAPGISRPPDLVPVSAIVNGIKCELAQTFAGTSYLETLVKQDPSGADIGGSLVLTNVVANGASVEGGVTIPLAVAVGLSGSAGRTDTSTQAFELKFSYNVDQKDPVPAYCTAPLGSGHDNVARVEGHPFVTMLNGVAQEYEKIERANPKVRLGSIAYTSKFEVKKEVGGGAKLSFLFFSLGGKASRADTAAQSLTLTFNLKVPDAIQIH